MTNRSPADSFGTFADAFMVCAALWEELHEEAYLAYQKHLRRIDISPAAGGSGEAAPVWVLVVEESWEPVQSAAPVPPALRKLMSTLAQPNDMPARKFTWHIRFALASAAGPGEWRFLGAEAQEQGESGYSEQGDGWVQEVVELCGDVLGQYHIAHAYSTGEDVPQDDALAFYWYGKAAQLGPSKWQEYVDDMFGNGSAAKCNLADKYEQGVGVEKNLALALHWYQQAAAQGNAVAQYGLGMMYQQGNGVAADKAQAAAYFRQSAAQSYEPALLELVRMG